MNEFKWFGAFLASVAFASGCDNGTANIHLPNLPSPGPTDLHPLGYSYDPHHHQAFNAVTQALNTAPPSADISQFNPPVGNQGQIGDCTSWSAGYGMAGYLANQGGAPALFAPMFIFRQAAPVGSTDFGMDITQVFGLMQSGGIDTAVDYDQVMPKTFTSYGASVPGQGNDAAANDNVDVPTGPTVQNALNYKLQSYQRVFDTAAQGSGVCPGYPGAGAAIQSAIASGEPVVVAIPVPPEFDTYNGVTPVPAPAATSKSRGGHAILCTKYDPQGLWCQNSWGTNWGKAGWVQLSWPFVESCIYESATAVSGFTAAHPTLATASIAAPSNGAIVSGSVQISIVVTPGTYPVASASVQVGGAAAVPASGFGTLFGYALDTTTLANGITSVVALVQDTQGNQISTTAISVDIENGVATPDAGNLQVTFAAPLNGQFVRGTTAIQIAASGAAPTATVSAITVVLDGNTANSATQPGSSVQFGFNTTAVADGTHTLSASATASDGENAQASISMTVDNTPPTTALTSPADGTTVSGAVSLNASAQDALSAITAVSFYANGALVGTASSAPFSLSWDSTQVTNGSYVLTVSATDSAGNVGQSQAATVAVQN